MSGGLALAAATLVFVALVVHRGRRRADERRRRMLEGSVGFTVDLVAVVLGSGGTVHQAVEAVASDGPPPVRPIFAAVLERASRGALLVDALAASADQLGPGFHALLGSLLAAQAEGAPVSSVLARLADDAEHRDRLEAEAAAGRLSVSLLPPLVLCLLPAVVAGTVVPLVVVALRHLRS